MPVKEKKQEVKALVEEIYKNNVVLCESRDESIYRLKRAYKLIRARKIDSLIYDTETTGLNIFALKSNYFNKNKNTVEEIDGVKIFMHQFGYVDPVDDILYCVWVDCEDFLGMYLTKQILDNPKITLIGHNLKYDFQVCFVNGIDVKCKMWDTLAATLITHNRLISHSLKYLGTMFSCGANSGEDERWDKEIKTWKRKAKSSHTREMNKWFKDSKGRPPNRSEALKIKEYYNYSSIPHKLMVTYALKDIWYTYLIYLMIRDNIKYDYPNIFNLEVKIIHELMDMERRGMRIDRKRCMIGYNRLTTKSRILSEKIDVQSRDIGWYGFNPNSPTQLKKYLVKHLKVPKYLMTIKKGKNKGKLSTEKSILENLINIPKYKNTMLASIMSLRAAKKIQYTYFENIISRTAGTAILNPNIKASETKTGRAASSNPSLQNIPRPDSSLMRGVPTVRSTFIPREGYANFYFDYAQIEMVVFALFCQDPDLLHAVNSGEDLHTATARLMFGDELFYTDPKKYRQNAKAINFGIVYGMGVAALGTALNISLNKAVNLLDKYFRRFPRVREIQKRCKGLLQTQGYVEDMFGRRYHVEIDKAYVSVNAITQGAAANILKLAMLQASNLISYLNLENDVCILMTIHDELKIEIHKKVHPWIPYLIKFAMEDIRPITRYGISPTVDIEKTTTTWEEKANFKTNKNTMRLARNYYNIIKENIIEPYPQEKVFWFLDC